MHSLELIKIGKITNSQGLEGNINLRHQLDKKGNVLADRNFIFIEIRNQSFIPFELHSKKSISHNELLLKLKDYNSVEEIKQFIGKDCYLEREWVEIHFPKKITHSIIGFNIVDEQRGLIGKIEELIESPGQVLATVNYNNNEVLIPLVDATIVRFDNNKKELIVNLPEGLLDIYQ